MAAKSFQINKIQVSDKNNTTNKKKNNGVEYRGVPGEYYL